MKCNFPRTFWLFNALPVSRSEVTSFAFGYSHISAMGVHETMQWECYLNVLHVSSAMCPEMEHHFAHCILSQL
jgi:hypothetical protein